MEGQEGEGREKGGEGEGSVRGGKEREGCPPNENPGYTAPRIGYGLVPVSQKNFPTSSVLLQQKRGVTTWGGLSGWGS